MIYLYPTETLYGLGVNVFSKEHMDLLNELKGREAEKTASWLVRNVEDIVYYGELSETAEIIANTFLPGPLTLVVPLKRKFATDFNAASDGTVGFRISSDIHAQKLIANFLQSEKAPLTCTSANVSGQLTLATTQEIMRQFSDFNKDTKAITQIIDDGPRQGAPSTVVRVIEDRVEIIREGSIPKKDIENLLGFRI